jgi:hypothetical protein
MRIYLLAKMVACQWMETLFIRFGFSKYVAQKTFPQFKFEAYLLMADKTKKSSIDGLNQMFRIPKMEIQERILSKSTFFEGDWQFGFIGNECG